MNGDRRTRGSLCAILIAIGAAGWTHPLVADAGDPVAAPPPAPVFGPVNVPPFAAPPSPPPLGVDELPARPDRPPPPPPDQSVLLEQLEMLGEFLQRSPAELQRMRKTIEMIERMPAADREFLRLRIRQITERSPTVERALQRWRLLLPATEHASLNKYWLSLSREARAQLEADLEAAAQAEAQSEILRERLTQFEARLARSLEAMRQRQAPPQASANPPG